MVRRDISRCKGVYAPSIALPLMLLLSSISLPALASDVPVGSASGEPRIAVAATGKPIASADEKILLSLKKSWRTFNGSQTWVPGKPCESWKFVTCDNSSGRVVELVSGNGFGFEPDPTTLDDFFTGVGLVLKGHVTLSVSIGGLTALTVLDLQNVGFSGRLPDSLGNLVNLKSLQLQGNNFTGPFPAFVSKLKKLESLNLGSLGGDPSLSNRFTDPVPESLAELPFLKELMLDGNPITSIPSGLGSHPALETLSLYSCSLEALPDTFTEKSTLQSLYMSSNRLTALPASLCRVHSLQDLFADFNLISGPLPACLGSLPALSLLVLGKNNFSGPIPPSYGKSKSLQTLVLANNSLSGPLPESISSLTAIVTFNVGYNQLSGLIPNLSAWSQVQGFYVGGNKFTGPLPSFPKIDSSNIQFDASDNYFTGPALIRFKNASVCAASHSAVSGLTVTGNCLTNVPKCKLTGQKSVARCNKFCGTLTAAGQCSNHGVCEPGPTATPSCSCSAGYKQKPKDAGSCIKA